MERKKSHNKRKLAKLFNALEGARNLLIVMQDNPDPDAIACAASLRRLALGQPQLTCTLAHGGSVGRAENQALVSYLGLNLRRFHDIIPDRFERVALVDTQPGTGNNALPRTMLPHIVIDHHPLRKESRSVAFTDIRNRYGAASTILFEYLQAAGITPEMPLATALLYGIRSDTQDLGRKATKADIEAHLELYPLANLRMLAQIEHSELPEHYYTLLHRALGSARRQGDCVCAPLGRVKNPDMMGEVADLLVRMEGVSWCMCLGAIEGRMLLSIRRRATDPSGHSAATIARQTVGRHGTSGGHSLIAGGQVELKHDTDTEIAQIEQRLLRAFSRSLNQRTTDPVCLVSKAY